MKAPSFRPEFFRARRSRRLRRFTGQRPAPFFRPKTRVRGSGVNAAHRARDRSFRAFPDRSPGLTASLEAALPRPSAPSAVKSFRSLVQRHRKPAGTLGENSSEENPAGQPPRPFANAQTTTAKQPHPARPHRRGSVSTDGNPPPSKPRGEFHGRADSLAGSAVAQPTRNKLAAPSTSSAVNSSEEIILFFIVRQRPNRLQ